MHLVTHAAAPALVEGEGALRCPALFRGTLQGAHVLVREPPEVRAEGAQVAALGRRRREVLRELVDERVVKPRLVRRVRGVVDVPAGGGGGE